MTAPLPPEPHEGIDAADNQESRASERDQSSYVARAGSSSGIVDNGPGPGDEQPSQAVPGGTAGGDALSGVTMTDEDVEDSVSGDTGPEHSGQRRSS
jgi:hypothetical protein